MRRRARARGDRGAAVIEFAIVLPVIMVLLLGMVSSASAWNQSQSLTHAGQMAARSASTVPMPTGSTDVTAWLDAVIDNAIASSAGIMDTGVDGRAICVAFVDPAGAAADKTVSRRIDAAGSRTQATTECFSDGLGTTARRVQVMMQRTSIIEIGFHRQTLDLRRTVVYRFEATGGL